MKIQNTREYQQILLFQIKRDDIFKFLQIENSKFDKLLEDPNLSVEKLLDEDSLINEFRSCNPRLLKKMKNYDFNKMVKYIIEEPTEQDDQKRQFKYPFIACEFLTCNVGIIPEQFFERESLTIEDEDSYNGADNEIKIEEGHSETNGQKTNDIQIKGSLSDSSEDEQEENKKPSGLFSFKPGQMHRLDTDSMEIEKDDTEHKNKEQVKDMSIQENQQNSEEKNKDLSINEEFQQKDKENQNNNSDQENNEHKESEMDISEEINSQKDQSPISNQIIEEQISKKAEEILSEALFQVLEEKKQHDLIRNELEQKYEKIPQDNMYLFGLLLSFFDTNREVNITLAGYVAKVFINLIQVAKNKGKEHEVIEYLYKNENNVLNIANHIHSRSCSDILVKAICFTNTLQKGQFLSTKLKVIDKLIDLISNESNDLEIFANCILAFTDIINSYTNYTDGKQIIEYIISSPIFSKILNNLTSSSSKVVFHNASIVCLLVSLFNTIESRRNEEDEAQFKEFDINFTDALQLFCTCIKDTVDYLKNYKQEETINTVYHQVLKPLGQARLKIIETYCVVLKLENLQIVEEMAKHNLFQVLQDLFIDYEWNNMLHTFVERILVQSAQTNSNEVRKAIFADSNLIQFLVDSTQKLNSPITEGSSKNIHFRKGNLGHITKIANFVQRLCENSMEVQDFVDTDAWMDFRDSFLDQINKDNKKDLGDHAIIDHGSPSSQLHCSYDIEEIKQKSEDFLYGPPSYQYDKDPENQVNGGDMEEKPENDDIFFSSIAKSIHEDDQEKKEENKDDQGKELGFEDPFFQPFSMTTSTEKPKFEGFEMFDVQPQQDQVKENQNSQQIFDDIFNSFQFTTSPQISPAQPEQGEGQNNENSNSKELQSKDKEKNNNNDGMDFFLQ